MAVSPLGMPLALLRDEIRVAFVGRTSTEDQQDPRQSIMRQLGNSKTALPDSWVIVAHFYDVESGRMELGDRGRKTGYDRFGIPIARDGGINDLLEEGRRPGRRFDAVICESVSRVARRTFEGLSIERELERAEVPLFAANEPITISGSRAQRILQRRINQSIAEYEVLNTLEQSWGGMCTHVREGWNIGKPPYGNRAKTYRHPNPTKAAKGLIKSRLEPDGVRGETVPQIALWRYHEKLGYDTIAERLNLDLAKYPPPEPPNKERARGAWSKTSVFEVLKNPKYTDFQVFNRRARRSRNGKVNDPVKWVWSPEPAHEPLIPKWLYDELAAAREYRRGSRDGGQRNTHPETSRTYLLRAMVFCDCGRRLSGTRRYNDVYYLCWPRGNNRGRPDKYAGHPRAVYIREDALVDAITRFFVDRVFGEQRRDIFNAELEQVDDHAGRARKAERERLERTVADLERRQAALIRQAQAGDADDPFAVALRDSHNALERDKKDITAAIDQLDVADAAEPRHPEPADAALLDALPFLKINLADAPEQLLRRLFEITQLSVVVHDETDHVTIAITLPGGELAELADTAERIASTMTSTQAPAACVDAVRAPGRTPTLRSSSSEQRAQLVFFPRRTLGLLGAACALS